MSRPSEHLSFLLSPDPPHPSQAIEQVISFLGTFNGKYCSLKGSPATHSFANRSLMPTNAAAPQESLIALFSGPSQTGQASMCQHELGAELPLLGVGESPTFAVYLGKIFRGNFTCQNLRKNAQGRDMLRSNGVLQNSEVRKMFCIYHSHIIPVGTSSFAVPEEHSVNM